MSPRKQLQEVDHARQALAAWLDHHPDGPESFHAALEPLVRPAATALGWRESELMSVFTLAPVIGMLRGLAYERAVRLSWPNRRGAPLEDFLAARGRRLRPGGRAYLRELTAAVPELLEIVVTSPGRSVDVRRAGGAGAVRTVHELAGSKALSAGDHVLAAVLPMPNGRIFAAGVLPIESDRVAALVGLHGETLLRDGVTAWAIPMFRQAGALLGLPLDESPEGRTADAVTPDAPHPSDANAGDANAGDARADAASPAHDTDPASRERLLERIRKLYAMAQQSEASPHEAEIALRRCQSLMARFGVTEADLETSDFTVRTAWGAKRVPMHVQNLAMSVGLLHDVLFVLNHDATPEFRGYEIDVRVATLTLDYLVDAVERALKARRRAGGFPPGRSASYDYRRGFAREVNERIEAIVAEREREERSDSPTGTALTVRKREIVERECGQDLGTSYSRTRGTLHPDAAAAGREDGARVSLDRQVGGGAAVPALPKP